MRGARWTGEGGAGPPTREQSGHLQAAVGHLMSLEEGPLTCPLGPGSGWGSVGSTRARAGSWHLQKVVAWGAWRRAPCSVQALAPALGGQVLRATVCFRDWVPGCL